jgi:hypothetical protein
MSQEDRSLCRLDLSVHGVYCYERTDDGQCTRISPHDVTFRSGAWLRKSDVSEPTLESTLKAIADLEETYRGHCDELRAHARKIFEAQSKPDDLPQLVSDACDSEHESFGSCDIFGDLSEAWRLTDPDGQPMFTDLVEPDNDAAPDTLQSRHG